MSVITIKDIARECGVGVSTVSRAMNNHPDINPETKELILETIKKYNYIPNNSARNLKRTDAKAIAVLVKGITNPFFSDMIRIIQQEAEKKKYSFILQSVDENEDELAVAIELVQEKKLRGIIFLGGFSHHPQSELKRLTVPFVLSTVGALEEMNTSICSSVSVDDFAESYKMTDYLCCAGHTKIAIIAASEEDESIGKQRLAGYQKALQDHGIQPDYRLMRHMRHDIDHYSMEVGYRMTTELLNTNIEFSALYCIADSLAIGALRAMTDAGKKVPQDYSIAGFDGIELGGYYTPSLTTIRQPVEQMAVETVNVLLGAIKEKPHLRELFDGELLIRESTRKI